MMRLSLMRMRIGGIAYIATVIPRIRHLVTRSTVHLMKMEPLSAHSLLPSSNESVAGRKAIMSPRKEGVGYGRLASKLALDNDLSIFRHFAELNIRNILYLQSELQELELKLQRLDAEANVNTREPSKWSIPRSYHYASRTRGTAVDGNDEYWNTVLRIREVLERYSMFCRS